MRAGHVPVVHTSSSQETWLSTPLTDPNARLWASISPPANPTITTVISRRAAGFSLDMLAYHLHRRFPETFSSRSSAGYGIVGASMVLGAWLGVLGYLMLASSNPLAPPHSAHSPASVVTQLVAARSASHPGAPTTSPAPASTGLVRLGETAVEQPVARRQAPTLAATLPPSATEQASVALTPRALTHANSATAAAKAKHAVSKNKSMASARRAARARRARVVNE
jgi:hypothetical protein